MIEAWRGVLNRWTSARYGSVNWKIFTAMLTVGGFHLIVSAVTAGKDLIVAHAFGTSDAMDAFLIAFLLPSLAINIVTGAFHSAFVPEFVKTREEQGPATAGRLFSNILGWYLILLFLLSLLMFVIAPFIVPMLGTGFEPEKLALAKSLFFLLIPTLLMSGVIKAWGSVFNAGERFALPTASPALTHIVTILVLLGIGKTWGIHALAGGMVAGLFFEACVLIWGLRAQGHFILPKLSRMDDATRKIIRQYFPMIVGLLLMGSTAFVDQTMAAMIGAGSVSALNYGNKVVLFILGIGSLALSTAIFPHFSRMVAQQDWQALRHTLKTYARIIVAATIPLTVMLVVFSEPLIHIIFERGAFTAEDTRLVGKVQAFYVLQLPFYILGILIVRVLSALAKNQILMVIGGVNLIVNIAGNYVCIQYWGVAGIGLSTSFVYLLSTVLSFLALNHQLRKKEQMTARAHA
ncbi:MAG: murein biosynthesis integral membrane protein MurJ [Nitrospiria bacterium]